MDAHLTKIVNLYMDNLQSPKAVAFLLNNVKGLTAAIYDRRIRLSEDNAVKRVFALLEPEDKAEVEMDLDKFVEIAEEMMESYVINM